MLDMKDLPNFEAAATCSIAAAAAAANRWLLSNMVGPDPLEFGNSILPPPGIDTVQDFLYTLDMKSHMHLVEITIFSICHIIVRPIDRAADCFDNRRDAERVPSSMLLANYRLVINFLYLCP